MLAFLVLGVLERTRAFPINDVSGELAWSAIRLIDESVPYYQELIAPLTEKGRHDLAQILQQKIARYHKTKKKYHWKTMAKRIDSKYLDDNLRKLKKSIRLP
jgi:hypothetical protein